MFYTHSDKPRILAAPLNCLQDIIHVWAVSIRQWGSIAFNAKYIRIIHLSFIQQKNVVQLLSHGRLFVTPWTAACQALLFSTISQSLLKSCPLSQWYYPTISSSVVPFSSCLQSFPASVFSDESALPIRWPKYWSFSLSVSPSNEYLGLISFWTDWFEPCP